MLGSHLSAAGGLHKALERARPLRLASLQVFTRNQRQWTAPPLASHEIELWRDQWQQTRCVKQVVSHVSYLINLASPDAATRGKSRDALRLEMQRCAALGISQVVMHPGSHGGDGQARGIERIAEGIGALQKEFQGQNVHLCLENTAGQGSSLGYDFEHLRQLIEAAREPEALFVCLDTAHAFAAGYELHTAQAARDMLEQFDAIVGLDRLAVLHLNDSKVPCGKRVDRHEHIGRGHIGPAAFGALVRHKLLRDRPMILETPKGETARGQDLDAINLGVLRALRDGKPVGDLSPLQQGKRH